MPAHDDGWAYEIKWDGYRTLAFVEDGRVRLQSSNQIDVTHKYPELAALAEGVATDRAILDAELVVLDDLGRPRFELIQRHERQAALYVFDVLAIDQHDTIDLPYEDRRRLLTGLVEPGDNWLVPAHRIGGGRELYAATEAQELEGVMAKRLGSTYQPGTRTKAWRKVKHRRAAQVVVGGFTAGSGNRAGAFGALLVGRWLDGPDGPAGVRRRRRQRVHPSAARGPRRSDCATCGSTTARSTRRPPRRIAAAPRGFGPRSRSTSRSPSSPTRASSAKPPSSPNTEPARRWCSSGDGTGDGTLEAGSGPGRSLGGMAGRVRHCRRRCHLSRRQLAGDGAACARSTG